MHKRCGRVSACLAITENGLELAVAFRGNCQLSFSILRQAIALIGGEFRGYRGL